LRQLGENLLHTTRVERVPAGVFIEHVFVRHDTEIGNCHFDLSCRVIASDGRAAVDVEEKLKVTYSGRGAAKLNCQKSATTE